MLGHERIGKGDLGVIVTNDWLCDTSTWDAARPYLDLETFQYAFADLRGYGRSRHLEAEGSAVAAARDVLEVADHLGWERFDVVGHSMSGLVAMHLAQQHPDRVKHAVALTPAPRSGFGVDDGAVQAMRAVALGGDEPRRRMLQGQWGDRLSVGWREFKLRRWRETSTPEAVATYVRMFAQQGLPDPDRPIVTPALLVSGEHDLPPLRAEPASRSWGAVCERLTTLELADCGHYPMQEVPPLLVAGVEAFLAPGESR